VWQVPTSADNSPTDVASHAVVAGAATVVNLPAGVLVSGFAYTLNGADASAVSINVNSFSGSGGAVYTLAAGQTQLSMTFPAPLAVGPGNQASATATATATGEFTVFYTVGGSAPFEMPDYDAQRPMYMVGIGGPAVAAVWDEAYPVVVK
jgi:hypothetical protein